MFPLPRILYAIASDGLIFRFLARINSRFKTPLIATLLSGLLAGRRQDLNPFRTLSAPVTVQDLI
jgi:hypothetical protein